MKRYEGLFILNLAGKEEGVAEAVDKVRDEIVAAGGKVETVQKMEKKPFARVADRRVNAGHYVNFIFDAKESVIAPLRAKFKLAPDVYRVVITEAPAVAPKEAQLAS